MNFNKDRFANFAKYDLTINKSFYRNMGLVTIAGAVCLALIGFISRYTMYHSIVNDAMDNQYYVPDPNGFEGYNWMYLTAIYEVTFFLIMMEIYAGCWLHNLRNKQGRITELTLPATNLEKFTWHSLLMIVGGFIVCCISMLLADGINALLTLISFGTENGITSLTASAWEMCSIKNIVDTVFNRTIGAGNPVDIADGTPIASFYHAFTFAIFCAAFLHIIIYLFGNALKYKYNIILTYIALQVLGTVGSIIFFITSAATPNLPEFLGIDDYSSEEIAQLTTIVAYAFSFVFLLIAAFLIWKSYNLYQKAQITSSFNK